MKFCALLLVLLAPSLAAAEDISAASLAKEMEAISLDPNQCYQVRDLPLIHEDVRMYFNDGYLILGKPIRGKGIVAVFSGSTEAGDAEILLFPPTAGERLSLATFTKSPNLSEHFSGALMLFTDDTAAQLMAAIIRDGNVRRRPEAGQLLASHWNNVARNLIGSFSVRMVQELMRDGDPRDGFFFAAVIGKSLGDFDVLYDPLAPVQVLMGQIARRNERTVFDVWTNFLARSFRNGSRKIVRAEMKVDDYRINATLRPDLRLEVRTRVKVTPEDLPRRAFAFDISDSMTITGAKVDGEPAEVFQPESLRENVLRLSSSQRFLVVSPKILNVGEVHDFEISAVGDVVRPAGNGVYFVSSRSSWYPNRDFQFARFDITFRYPSDLSLVASGSVVEDRTDGEWRISRRVSQAPMRLVGFNVGHFDSVRVERGGLSVELYANKESEPALQPPLTRTVFLPELPGLGRRTRAQKMITMTMPQIPPPTAHLHEQAEEIADAYARFAAIFGPPPLKELTASPIPGEFGQGFPGLLYLSTRSYLPQHAANASPKEVETELFFSQVLHAHEVAHQWWGNLVTFSTYQDEWLQEALANYSALLLLEERRGTDALDVMLDRARQRLLAPAADGRPIESVGPIRWGTRLMSSLAENAWQVITYDKGSWILHMLRLRMGDAQFLKFLGEICRRYRFASMTTDEFRELAAQYLPPKSPDPTLENFFDQWVEGTGIPTLKLDSKVTGKPPAVTVDLTLRQSDVADDVSILVPVEVIAAGGGKQTYWMRTSDETAHLAVKLRRAPVSVRIAPESVLATIK